MGVQVTLQPSALPSPRVPPPRLQLKRQAEPAQKTMTGKSQKKPAKSTLANLLEAAGIKNLEDLEELGAAVEPQPAEHEGLL